MARVQGRLIEWHDDKGYGFVQPLNEPQHKVFLHIKNFERTGPRPIVGCVVEYALGIDSQSRPQAIHVRYVKANQVGKNPPTHTATTAHLAQVHKKFQLTPAYVAIVVYWVSVLVFAVYHLLIPFTLLFLSVINSYSYWIYSQDKQRATLGERRVPEQHLLLCALLGGWTASVLAQKHFHHKTIKQPFQRYFQLMSVAHCILLMASIAIYAL